MIKTISVITFALAMGVGPAIAEEAAQTEAAGQSGGASGQGVSANLTGQELLSYCVYNGKVFSPGIEICVRKGFAYKCNPATKDKEAQWSAMANMSPGGTETAP